MVPVEVVVSNLVSKVDGEMGWATTTGGSDGAILPLAIDGAFVDGGLDGSTAGDGVIIRAGKLEHRSVYTSASLIQIWIQGRTDDTQL